MPNLLQMFNTVNSKTAYSRPDEIYPALEEAGFLVFSAILKEFSGFFLKFDTTSIVLTPGQSVYPLPPDLGNLVCLAERQTAAENWHQINPESLSDALTNTQSIVSWSDWDDLYDDRDSHFRFYGPYLPMPTPGAAQIQQINITPAIDAVRMCEIAYTAKWLPITNQNSLNTLPNEGTYAQQNYAIAEIHRGNDDTLSKEYEGKGDKHLTAFLSWVRNRQTVRWPTITPYLGG
jgi:hypothetical protein